MRARKKTTRKKVAPAAPTRRGFVKHPSPEPAPPEPEWVDDRFAAAWSRLIPIEGRDDAEARHTRDLLIATPPFTREQDRPGQRRKRKQPKRTDELDFHGLKARVQAAVLALDELEGQGQVLSGKLKANLAELVTKQAGTPISERTLRKAEKYRRGHSCGLF